MSDSGRADALLADLPRDGRGRLKVFLGAAPGVGKTYAMLQAAHTQLRQGVKVLAGVVETHGRAETEALLGGLPQQPLLRSEYRGVMLEEMDLDGILAARPKLVLVDELAHSNAPGSRHAKRWQDIQELLAAGIDVFTTVNVQHLESLNDQVRGITGVQVRETLPDWVLQEAFELLLIDLPPRELLERLREGKVYVPEQARAAIDAFFTQTNLTALRELAMQTAAAQVDNDLAQGYRQLGQAAPAVRGRLLVGVDGDAQAERLVRHASRVAQRRHLPWSLVHVDNGSVRDEQSRLRLQSAQQLAERLGGEVVLLRAGEVAKTLIQHAAERRASLVLVGQSRPRLRRRLFGGGLAARLLRQAHGLEINVLDSDEQPQQPRPHNALTLVWFDYALALVATLLATALAWAVSSVLPLPNISLVFLAAVLLVAVRSSLGPALACAALSFLTYDFLFIPPNFSFSIQREEDVLTLLFFLLMAALTGNLAARQRRQLQALRDTQEETSELLDLSRKLTAATDRQAVVSAAAQHLNGWNDLQLCLLNRDGQGGWKVETGGPLQLTEAERAAADWAWQHDQPAGMGTGTLPLGRWWWWPLSVEDGPLALLGVCAKEGQSLSGQRRRLLTALSQPLAQALARAQLAEFSPAHGRLQLDAGADDQEIFFSVSDEGPGIPEDERAKIFDMFYTAARGDRGGQGTGLGLAICQGMVGAHGGRISVADGIDGRGTCITLHLPLQTQPGMDGEA